MPHRGALAASFFLLGLSACVTRFDVDAGAEDAAAHDVALLFDAALADAGARDTRSGADRRVDDAAPRDLQSPADRESALDQGGHGLDRATFADAGAASDASGNAQIGQHCEDRPCGGDAICIGDSSNAICRLRCQPGAGSCDPQSEYCTSVTLPDGGPSPNGACVPGQDLDQPCVSTNCAEIYICVYMGADAAAMSCHSRCQPSANDPGCTGGSSCVNINGQDGGACF